MTATRGYPEAGVNVNQTTYRDRVTLLHVATRNELVSMTYKLRGAGAGLESKCIDEIATPLLWAVSTGHIDTVKALPNIMWSDDERNKCYWKRASLA